MLAVTSLAASSVCCIAFFCNSVKAMTTQYLLDQERIGTIGTIGIAFAITLIVSFAIISPVIESVKNQRATLYATNLQKEHPNESIVVIPEDETEYFFDKTEVYERVLKYTFLSIVTAIFCWLLLLKTCQNNSQDTVA